MSINDLEQQLKRERQVLAFYFIAIIAVCIFIAVMALSLLSYKVLPTYEFTPHDTVITERYNPYQADTITIKHIK